MGLFGRDDKSPQSSPVTNPAGPRPTPSAPGPHQSATTIVAGSTSIEGTLGGSNDLHIEGEITGEVNGSGRLVIAESGRAKARLHARVVMVAGTVEGDVSADERIELQPSARLTGNITAPRVIIQEGATFDGQVFMKKAHGGKAVVGKQSAPAAPADGEAAASDARPTPEGGPFAKAGPSQRRDKNRR